MKTASLLCLLLSVLLLSSCTIKTNIQTNTNLNYELGLQDGPCTYWELEAETPKVLGDQVDFTFSFGYNFGKDEGELSTVQVGELFPSGSIPEISTSMWEIRSSARWFPFRKDIDVIKPYVGLGLGYFDFKEEVNKKGEYVSSDFFWNYYEIDSDTSTLASGFFPFFSAGFYLPIGKPGNDKMNTVLQFEYRNDFNKGKDNFDLSGSQFTIGFGVTWK